MKTLLTTFLIIASGTAAFASSTAVISFTALPVTQGNGATQSQANTYNGAVTATINGIPAQSLVCDDFADTTYVPSSQIDFSVESLSSLSGSRFTNDFATGLTGESASGMTQGQAYATAAVLLTNLETAGNTAQQITDYQYAIWDLMLPGNVDGSEKDGPLDTNAANYLQMAFSAATTSNPTAQTLADEKNLVIYTPTAAYSSNQEFLGLTTTLQSNTSPTPEPSSFVLLAGLALVLSAPKLRARFAIKAS